MILQTNFAYDVAISCLYSKRSCVIQHVIDSPTFTWAHGSEHALTSEDVNKPFPIRHIRKLSYDVM